MRMVRSISITLLAVVIILLYGCGMMAFDQYESSVLSEINGKKLHVIVPDNLIEKDSPLANGETISQKSDDGAAEVIITGEKDEDDDLVTYIWSIQINNESAGNEFEYKFSNMDNRKIVHSEENDSKGGVCIVEETDDGEVIVEEISEPVAHDANGNPVESYYRIEGSSLIQVLELTKDTVYPVTIE